MRLSCADAHAARAGLAPYASPMATTEWVRALARYNRWMNEKLYEAAATLSDEARKRDVAREGTP